MAARAERADRAEAPDLFAHFGVSLERRVPMEKPEPLAGVVEGLACVGCGWLLRPEQRGCPVCGVPRRDQP